MGDTQEKDTIISARNVKRIYYLEGEEVQALRGVDIDIYRGEYISIMGPSGSGKSTLFNMIGGLDLPTSGEVFLDGENICNLSERKLAWLRCNKIGYVFQSFNLMPTMTALENVSLPLIFSGVPLDEVNDKAALALEKVGLADRLHHKPFELSGGQQQRVACARAIANNPSVILADEPTGNLDLKTGEDILALLKSLQKDIGSTIISATHDLKMLKASDRVVWIVDGQIDRIEKQEDLEIRIGQMDGESVM